MPHVATYITTSSPLTHLSHLPTQPFQLLLEAPRPEEAERPHLEHVPRFQTRVFSGARGNRLQARTMTPSLDEPFVDGKEHRYNSMGDATRGAGRCKHLPCNSG